MQLEEHRPSAVFIVYSSEQWHLQQLLTDRCIDQVFTLNSLE